MALRVRLFQLQILGCAPSWRPSTVEVVDETIIEDPIAIRLLADPKVRRFLEPFMGCALETATAARGLGVSTEKMAYWVGRFHRAELLSPAGQRIHAGRPVISWRAAPSFRCPLSALPEGEISTAFAMVDEPGRQAFHSALARNAMRRGMLAWDLRVHRQDDHVLVSISPSDSSWLPGDPHPAAPAVVLSWAPLAMTLEQASILQRRLKEVLEGFEVEPHNPTHLCGLFLTPLNNGDQLT